MHHRSYDCPCKQLHIDLQFLLEFIIIMQRRKIFSNLKNKPKLIIDRQRLITRNQDKNDEVCPLSIIKIQPTQDYKKHFNKQYSNHSFSSKKRELSQKKVNFNIRQINTKENKNISSKTLRQPKAFSNHHLYHQIQNLDQFIAKTIKKLEYSPHVFHFSGDLTLSSIFLQRTIRIIIEQLSITAIDLNSIYAKLQKHFEKEQVSTKCFSTKKCIHSNTSSTKLKCQKWKIQSFISWRYPESSNQIEDQKEQMSTIKSSDKMKVSLSILQLKNQTLEQLTQQRSLQLPFDQTVKDQHAFIFQHLRSLNDFILNQPNKILHDTFRRHKYLEEELFAYADLLSNSKFGAQTYTTQINITIVDANIDRDMKNLNRTIIQGSEALDTKCRMLRNFSLTLRQSYNNIVLELMKVLDKKTAEIKTFVNKTLKWHENYITRKEYLENLKKEYCKQLHFVNATLKNLKLQLPYSKHSSIQNLQESICSIDKIYKLGNSFY